MKGRSTSIATRAAWAAFASAVFAAAISAISAIAISDLLVLRQTDRHLVAAATELAREIGPATDPRAIERAAHDEQEEATAAGIRLVVYGPAGALIAGDSSVKPTADACATQQELRVCGAAGAAGTKVYAATLRETAYGLLTLAAAAAASLAGIVAWVVGRVLSRRAVDPLVRLQARIATMPLDGAPGSSVHPQSLGADEGVTEVDELRAALVTLLGRMHDAIDRSALFAANAAHEFRTPLTSLRAELELMAEASSPSGGTDTAEERRRSLAVALRKVEQLHAMAERLLALATPDAGLDGFAIVSIRDVVDEAIAMLGTEETERVVAGAEDADVVVRGDAEALRIAVSNGLTNALKFGKQAKVEITSTDSLAVVAIEDDGPGVPEEERLRVFEPFARGGAARGVPGHGLGLALVSHVAKRHRGKARLTSPRHGESGARLEIELPLAGSAAKPPASEPSSPSST